MTNPSANRSSPGGRASLKLGLCLMIVLAFLLLVNASFDPLLASAPNGVPLQQGAGNRSRTPSPSSTLPVLQVSSSYASDSRAIIGQTAADANTVALYHFDADATDATGKYDGTFYGDAAVTSQGLYGGALQVSGSGSLVRVPANGKWDMSQGTLEAFIDFSTACGSLSTPSLSIISAGADYGGARDLLRLRIEGGGLVFGVYANGQWYWANSGINACRYLAGGYPPAASLWPYETWRFHHVAGTWGPRGLEIWVDGVLHGVGTDQPLGYPPYAYACNPQQQMGGPQPEYPPNDKYPVCKTPVMAPLMTATPPGDYAGGVAAFNNLLIGCDSFGSCFKGRLDEVRISNVQREFHWDVDPTSTPPPTLTPVRIAQIYSPDPNTLGLYHLDFSIPNPFSSGVYNEVTTKTDAFYTGNVSLTYGGRYNGGVALPGFIGPSGTLPQLEISNLGSPTNGTLEAWVKLESTAGIINFFNAQSENLIRQDRMLLGMHMPRGNVGFAMDIGGSWVWADSQIYPQDLVGSWHHLAGTWGARGMELWLDGRLCTTYPFYGKIYSPLFRYNVGCDVKGNCMQGSIDEVRLSTVQRVFTSLADPYFSAKSPRGDLSLFSLLLPLVQQAPTPARDPCKPM